MAGAETLIPMKAAAGGITPTQIHLPDSRTIRPDADGQFLIPAIYLASMLNSGLQMVIAADATHVP